jgi:hypothetical protein
MLIYKKTSLTHKININQKLKNEKYSQHPSLYHLKWDKFSWGELQ